MISAPALGTAVQFGIRPEHLDQSEGIRLPVTVEVVELSDGVALCVRYPGSRSRSRDDQSDAGASVANTSVKEMIADIIAAEDPGAPRSDQEIVGLLQEKGLKIARRTVAKYREELGLLPSNLRRRYD